MTNIQKLFFLSMCACAICVPVDARANNNQVAPALFGGIAGALLEHAIDHANQPPPQTQQPQQQQQIQWSNGPGQPPPGAPLRYIEPHQNDAAIAVAKADHDRLVQIQSDLKTLGFLDNPSGKMDSPTTLAIKAWQTAFNVPIDGKITDKQVDLLHLAAGGGFKTGAEYNAAQKAGFSYEPAYAAFKISGFATKADFDNAQQNGFDTKAEADDALAAGFNNAKDYTVSKITPARNLIDDLQAFLPTYKDSLDTVFITSSMKKLSPINSGEWTPETQSAFSDLKAYGEKLTGFPAFEKTQDENRQKQGDTTRANIVRDIQMVHTFSDQFLRGHLSDSRAVNLSDAISKNLTPSMSMTKPQLETLSEKTNAAVAGNNLQEEYMLWRSSQGLPVTNAPEPDGSAEDESLPERHLTPAQPTPPPFMGKAAARPFVIPPIKTGSFEVTILSVQELPRISSMIFSKTASPGGTLLAITYSIKNIGDTPTAPWETPSIQLKDVRDTAYSEDWLATSAYSNDQNDNKKVLSYLNPGISENGEDVYEISSDLFNAGGWKLEVNGDKTVDVPLN